MYADDLRAGGNTSDGVSYSMQLFKKRGFNLHKCNSNVSKLQNNNSSPNSKIRAGKQRLNQDSYEAKIVGLVWHGKDALSVVTSAIEYKNATK